MTRASRQKGKRGELEAVHQLARYSVEAHRSGDAGQIDGDLDIEDVTEFPYYVEVRRRERFRVAEWIEEIVSEAPEHLTPILMMRRSNERWIVAMTFDDFMRLATGREPND